MANEDYMPEHRAGGDLSSSQVFSNSTYDVLKWVAQIFLPALGALYFGLAQIWEFPAGEEVVGSIVVIDTFLGVLLGVSSSKYKDVYEGKLVGFADVNTDEEGNQSVMLNFPGDPHELLENEDRITFKVRRSSS